MRVQQRYEYGVVAAVVALFAAYFGVVVATSNAPEYPSQYGLWLLTVVVIGVPWVLAVRHLWRVWWARDVARLPVVDGPAVVLAAAVAAVPDDRRKWGQALEAELPHVAGRVARWSFAFGGARAALFPPHTHRAPVIVVGVLTAVVAGVFSSVTLPAMVVFALVLGALGGAIVARTAMKRRNGQWLVASAVMAIGGTVGVGVSIAVTAQFLARHPTAVAYFTPTAAAVLAVVLAGCLWLAMTSPRGLTTSRLARGVGVGAALVLALGFFVTSRLSMLADGGPMIWVALAPVVISFIAGATAARASGSRRVGIQAAVWTGLFGALLVYAGWLPEASNSYVIDGRLLLDGDSGIAVGENLIDAIGVLVLIIALSLPFGVIGAAFGADGSLRAIGLRTPASPALASLLLCLPFTVLALVAGNDSLPFKTWFSPDQWLAPVGQAMLLGSVVCLLLALLYALTAMYRQMMRLASLFQ